MKLKRLPPSAAKTAITIAAMLATPLFTQAAVNMKDASYSHIWVDTIVSPGGRELRIQRRYDSRSLFDGVFGFGWCSDLDTSLTEVSPGRLSLRECGAETEIPFHPSTKDAKRFHAPSLPSSFITDRGGYFIRLFLSGSEQRFSREGKLLSWKSPKGEETQILYDKQGNPQHLWLTHEPTLFTLVLDPLTHKLNVIRGQGSNELRYTRSAADLTKVEWPSGSTIEYRYDKVHNLTRIDFPDRSRESMIYEQDKDWILSVRDRKGCTETFEYSQDETTPDHFVSRSQMRCGEEVKSRNRLEFWHKRRSDGRKYLARAVIERANDNDNGNTNQWTDITFDPDLGHTLAIKRRVQ